MGRPRGFDEAEVVRSAAELFAVRAYDGISIDDLVAHLGVHRNSLYKTFGSKRGLYLAALRRSLEHDFAPLVDRVAQAAGPAEGIREALAESATTGLDLLLLAAVERAPVDPEVAELVAGAFSALDRAIGAPPPPDDADGGTDAAASAAALTALLLGLRVRARSTAATVDAARVGAVLARRLGRP
ncbi:TetR/AcrR family transcriptional regulator [Allostreptomyces psammosilenae]|uniref:TetR/AcrR family transcriptional repressor of nem operon n=1 Tax=Allostreptomyces psammosilenae TaxID=1892865 RepID=A0A852ZQD4_9ACTN|nr:TetR/AcrR family transcriptional regulator [Allostreptomyces psammosilenae]NYI04589.1 TetR/AcrR family transcriptional repressor of nem operon [Allostreptomyces psammosilenae]